MKREVGVQSSLVWASQCTQTTCLARSIGTNTESPPSGDDVGDNCGVAHHNDRTTYVALAYVKNTEVLSEGPFLKHSLSEGLSIHESSVEGAQYGVFAFKPLPKGLHFGPFQCVKVDNGEGSGHTWQVRRSGEVFLVDGRQPDQASWMHSVNYAPTRREQNLVAILKDGEIYYRTRRPIIAGEELLVAYNTTFTNELLSWQRGTGAVAVDSVSGIPLHCAVITCDMCGALFTTREFLNEHRQHKHRRHKRRQSLLENHRCAHCSYSSSRRSSVTCHERTHTGEKPYACCQCGKRFRVRAQALRHERVVHDHRYSLYCPRCGFGTEDVWKLRRHVCKKQAPLETPTQPQETVTRGQGHALECGEGDVLVG